MDIEKLKTEIYNLPIETRLRVDDYGNTDRITMIKADRDYLWDMIIKAISVETQVTPNKEVVEGQWQKCPKCGGQGIVSKPPYVAGDVYTCISTSAVFVCDVCNGAKIIRQ